MMNICNLNEGVYWCYIKGMVSIYLAGGNYREKINFWRKNTNQFKVLESGVFILSLLMYGGILYALRTN